VGVAGNGGCTLQSMQTRNFCVGLLSESEVAFYDLKYFGLNGVSTKLFGEEFN